MNKETMLEIEQLQMKLSYLASDYRSCKEDSALHHTVLETYYLVFNKLVELNGGIIALDLDAELPDHVMPKEYVDFWLNAGSAHK